MLSEGKIKVNPKMVDENKKIIDIGEENREKKMDESELDFQRMLYVRVSDVISKQNFEELRSIPLETLANAAIRGTKVHDYCTTLVKGLWLPDIEEEYAPYVDAFMRWYDQNVFQTLYTNTRLYDDNKKFTGEFDMIVVLKESREIAMLDLKTSANVSRSWPIQLAAYKHLCELNGYEPDAFLNIHLKKTKPAFYENTEEGKVMITPPVVKANPIRHDDLKPYWEIFSSALRCYDYFNRKEAA